MANEIFNRLRHPGKFAKSVTITTGAYDCTGVNYGVCALIRGTGATGTVTLSNGGTISLSDLDAGVVHELSVESISSVANGNVYLLLRA